MPGGQIRRLLAIQSMPTQLAMPEVLRLRG